MAGINLRINIIPKPFFSSKLNKKLLQFSGSFLWSKLVTASFARTLAIKNIMALFKTAPIKVYMVPGRNPNRSPAARAKIGTGKKAIGSIVKHNI